MKKLQLLLLLLFGFASMYAQETKTNPYGSKYDDKNFNGLKVVQVIDASGFKPIKITTDLKEFKSILLQLSERAYTQINIDTWYLCSYKHEEKFQIYNMYYKTVARNFYDDNCKALIALMLVDGTIKQPK
jgi:hypothetical protein